MSYFLLQGSLRTKYEDYLLNKYSLTEEDKNQLRKVTHLDHDFLNGLQNGNLSYIHTVDLSLFVSVKSVGKNLLHSFQNLVFVDFSQMKSVEIISENCCSGCPKLTSVDISGFRQVRYVGARFLDLSENVKVLDVGALRYSCTFIGEQFLHQKSSVSSPFTLKNLGRLKNPDLVIVDGWLQKRVADAVVKRKARMDRLLMLVHRIEAKGEAKKMQKAFELYNVRVLVLLFASPDE